jgi:hypothetical protein
MIMAIPVDGLPDRAQQVIAAAAVANSVPALRAEVVRLAEAVQILEAALARLLERQSIM